MKVITRTIWILSLVSLFTDTASEMLYPIMPIYLRSIGFSMILIGVLEGVAEATAGLSKGYFGKLSDQLGKRAPFVRLGYSLSAISKPLLAFFINVWWVFFARTIDRLGKGIRTGARDALLSDESSPENKAKVFGFHRSMDTLGAVLGPLVALVYLYYNPGGYKILFLIAFVPGLFAIAASFLLKEHRKSPQQKSHSSFFSFFGYWNESSSGYRRLVVGLLLFTLFNSSDVFLLLKMKQAGLTDTWVIGVYIFYNLVYALSAFPLGIVADRIGVRTVFICGMALFVIVYGGMGGSHELTLFMILFFLYGIYAAATEGISKAWIASITKRERTGTAIGLFTGLQSICSLLASTFAGLLWFYFGASTTFYVSAGATLLVILYIVIFTKPPVPPKN